MPRLRALSTAFVLAGLMFLFVAACDSRPGPSGSRPSPPRVSLSGTYLTAQATLWRDFQPSWSVPPGGEPLVISITVMTVDGTPVPASVGADSVRLRLDGQTWSAPVTEEESRTPGAPEFRVLARGGPKWQPGAWVDVTLRLTDESGKSALLVLENQPIIRTD